MFNKLTDLSNGHQTPEFTLCVAVGTVSILFWSVYVSSNTNWSECMEVGDNLHSVLWGHRNAAWALSPSSHRFTINWWRLIWLNSLCSSSGLQRKEWRSWFWSESGTSGMNTRLPALISQTSAPHFTDEIHRKPSHHSETQILNINPTYIVWS